MVYESGDVFEGDWVDDQRSGLGVLSHGTMSVPYLLPLSNFPIVFQANGDRYEGHWLDDKKEGPGRFFYRSTHKLYEGEWVDDVAKCGVSGLDGGILVVEHVSLCTDFQRYTSRQV